MHHFSKTNSHPSTGYKNKKRRITITKDKHHSLKIYNMLSILNREINYINSSSLVLCPRAGPWLPILQFSRFSAFLFISPYVSSNTSSIMPIFGLPLGLFLSILPSSTNFIRPSPLTTCPIQFFFLSHIVFIKLLFSFMELSTCSFVLLSIQLTFPILFHTHISKAFLNDLSLLFSWSVSHIHTELPATQVF